MKILRANSHLMKKIPALVCLLAFLFLIPFAFIYVSNFDRHAGLVNHHQDIVIQVAAVEIPKQVGTLKKAGVSYNAQNRSVRIMVLNLTRAQVVNNQFDITLVKSGQELHALVANEASQTKLMHINAFLSVLSEFGLNILTDYV